MDIATGQFTPGPGHVMAGGFTFQRTADGVAFATTDDFFFDGSPDPRMALSRDGTFDDAIARAAPFLTLPGTELTSGQQLQLRGRHAATFNDDFDPLAFNAVFLWCFRVPALLGWGRIISQI